MTLPTLIPNRKDESARLRKRLGDIDAYLERLQADRAETHERLLRLESANVHCPKCGRDRDFLTDEGGYLAHVLEDPADQELLAPGKPLYCPKDGEVFLYDGGLVPATRRPSPPRKKA